MHRHLRSVMAALVAAAVAATPRANSAQQSSVGGAGTIPEAVLASADRNWVPATTSAVAPMQRAIALDLSHASLAQALDQIAARAEVHVWYNVQEFPKDATVSLHVLRMPVAQALADALAGTRLQAFVSLDGRDVLVRPLPRGLPAAVRQGSATVSGRVTDGTLGSPLSSVAVHIEGTAFTTTTDADGKYVLANIATGAYRVTARRVGYQQLTRDVSVAGDAHATLDFALTALPTKLDEVVTTALGEQRRYQIGNVISAINADSIVPTAPITDVTDLISARAPGVEVVEAGGLTGSGETIRIRGQSSLALQSDPIVIVDGVREQNSPGGIYIASGYVGSVPSPARLNDIDVNDIASIDVLKGPAASTEYGTDAADGVIVITTKHGTAGRPQWHASAEQTESGIPVSFPSLYYSWGHRTDGTNAPVACPLIPFTFAGGYGSTGGTCTVDSVTSWDPLNSPAYSIFGSGMRGKYDLSVSGGSDAVRYFVSGGLSNETGILHLPSVFLPQAVVLGLPRSAFEPNGEQQRSVRTNTAIKLGATADLALSTAYLSTYQHAPNSQSLYRGLIAGVPLRDSVDNFGYGSGEGTGIAPYNPVYQFGLPVTEQTDRLAGGMTANWRPEPWLTGHATVGVDHGSQGTTTEILPQVQSLWPFIPAQLGIGTGTTDIYTMDVRGSATAAVTRAVRAVTSVGLQLADTRVQGENTTAKGITTTNQTLNGAVNTVVQQIGNRQATLGGYGEEQIGILDRLYVTGALRIDAASGFGRNYATAAYPKASVSWLALQTGPTTIRLRGAFGESGIQPPNGAALQLYAPTTNWLNGGSSSTVGISNAENPNLQPERSAEYEGGFDVGLWQNRVTVELTGYSKTTHNALVGSGTGWELGGFAYEENIGEVRNTGVEGALTATIVQARTVTWDVSLNGSVNHNKLVSLAPGVQSQNMIQFAALVRFAPGNPLYSYAGPQVHYADLNGDGLLELGEVTLGDSLAYAGSSLPTQELSFGSHLALGRGAISVGALFDYRGGFRVANATAFYAAAQEQSDYASNFRNAPLWQQARDVAADQITVSGFEGDFIAPKGFYEDGSFVRFRELSLTYTLPRRAVRALRVNSLTLTGAVRNLALWTRYSGPDPEVSSTYGESATLSPTSNTSIINNDLREDSQAVPLLRYWVLRLNIGM